MVFRFFYRIIYGFVFNEKTIDRLADSYPIRTAARLVSRALIRGQRSIEDNMKNINKQEFIEDFKNKATDNSLTRISQRFTQAFKEELNKAKEEIKRKQR